ncbi:MAG: hypothetical protein BRC40_08700 [Cyanobacteria bacterium QH_8_48_120]|nr:MAG: hypothetical protein BRC38_07840 [Cyanobacteria bacterium QH_6_48_35]PSO73291.1 MAG: hypothetical protein BRC40_08700 [Cyanobacteria bacterium QH_8_48_120]
MQASVSSLIPRYSSLSRLIAADLKSATNEESDHGCICGYYFIFGNSFRVFLIFSKNAIAPIE